ncbi:hypothetical protein [Bacillus sp. Marseille-Q3570]|uniref:hypothetical protein n=1 Tax=Bacillus sp. Marseille-Q3570 TaxID=2963522 RepID=UPI0021B6ECD8|nr:hypothetical protein [Bacillus sp. Marseille-Q3570]
MKNFLFGLLTLAVLLGISSIAVSPELTDLFVDEESMIQLKEQREASGGHTSSSKNPEDILQLTGQEWQSLSTQDRLTFAIHLKKGLKSKDIHIEDPNQLLDQIDTYFENKTKDDTIEKAVMVIITESTFTD